MDETVPSPPAPLPDTEVLERGVVVGRYVIVDVIGEGGMGVVYKAYDPPLERAVALKVLRPHAALDPQGRQRLMREAQALAQLSHPNVVTVYDVGEVDGAIFIAIELVPGVTLREWLASERRTPAEILDAFAQAGAGLAAAHAAGIVHRDFKPSNVIVGDDRRVRVLDFGLAFEGDRPLESRDPDTPVSGPKDRLTLAGTVMGTPHYMAPEQHLGEASDARTDQFSFCIALHEALFGEFPFEPRTPKPEGEGFNFKSAVLFGRIREAPGDVKVRKTVRAALIRGLAIGPDDRWPDMDSLLRALAYDPASTRRRFLLPALTAVGLAGVLALAWQANRVDHELCSGARSTLTGVWDDARREALRKVFLGADHPSAVSLWETTVTKLDAYAGGWRSSHQAICSSLRARGERANGQLVCLDRMRTRLGATVDLFLEDPSMVPRGPQAALGLRDTCTQAVAAPAAVEKRWTDADEQEIRDLLARGTALHFAGRQYGEGGSEEYARRAETRARALGHRELLIEALLLRGYNGQFAGTPETRKAVAEAEAALREASNLAVAMGADDLAARAETHLVMILALKEGRYEEAHRAADRAEALVARAGNAPLLRRFYLQQLGVLLALEGRFEESYEVHDEALRLYGDIVDMSTFSLHLNQHEVAVGLGRLDEAEKQASQLVAFSRQHLGPEHFRTSYAHLTQGRLWVIEGKYRAAADAIRSFGMPVPGVLGHGTTAWSWYSLALVLSGDRDELPENYTSTFTGDLADVNRDRRRYLGLHMLYRELGDRARAQAALDGWLETERPVPNAIYQPVDLTWWQDNLAIRLLIEDGRLSPARANLEVVHAEQADAAPGHPSLAFTHANEARLAIAEGRLDEARAPLEAAIAGLTKINPEHPDLPELRAALAKIDSSAPR